MNSRKPLVLIGAAVLAALAVVILFMWSNGLQDRANNNAKMINVWVVRQPVAKGTYGQKTGGMIVKDQIPQKVVPSTAIKDLTQINNKVAISDLPVNSVVVEGMFADPATQTVSLSNQLKPINKVDQVAVTINVNNVQGVAGLIVPGDFVNIMVTNLSSQTLDEAGGDGGGAGAGAPQQMCGDTPIPNTASRSDFLFCEQAVVLMQKVQVLAVGTNAIPTPAENASGADASQTTQNTNTGLLTFIVPMKYAQMIASVTPGHFYLALTAKDFHPKVSTRIKPNAKLPSEDPAQLTPYGPEGPT